MSLYHLLRVQVYKMYAPCRMKIHLPLPPKKTLCDYFCTLAANILKTVAQLGWCAKINDLVLKTTYCWTSINYQNSIITGV